MITLTTDAQRVYTDIMTNVIPNLTSGDYSAKDFFGAEPVCPRIVRRLYEEVSVGTVARTSLVGTKSAEGYRVV